MSGPGVLEAIAAGQRRARSNAAKLPPEEGGRAGGTHREEVRTSEALAEVDVDVRGVIPVGEGDRRRRRPQRTAADAEPSPSKAVYEAGYYGGRRVRGAVQEGSA